MTDLEFTEKIEPQKILKLLSRSLPYYLDAWQDLDEKRGLFGNTSPQRFNMQTVGSSSPVIEYVLRPHLNVLCALGAYLYLNQTDMLKTIVAKEELVRMFRKGILWVCDTHITGTLDVPTFLERKRWGENWKSSLWASLLGVIATFGENVLDETEQIRVREIIAHEADRFTGVMPPSGVCGDSKAEENALDMMLLAWAINLCPYHPHLKRWEKTLAMWAVNIASSVHDGADHSEYFGMSVSRAVTTCNLYPDFTAENHGFYHPEALAYGMWIVLASAAYLFQRREPPPCLSQENHKRAFDILIRFCLPNGLLFAPGGHDMPLFMPRPFVFALGHASSDPRARHMTGKLLAWMDTTLVPNEKTTMPWVRGFEHAHDGWTLFFQSQVGMELALLACIPFPKEQRSYSAGQVENAIDTRHIYPYIEVCYRRNVRSTRSVAWKAIGGHPMIGLNLHAVPELVAPFKASLLGVPATDDPIKFAKTLFHNDKSCRDGFDTCGRIVYYGASGKRILERDLRVITWGEEGLVVLDQIRALEKLHLYEQYLSPIYIVNDLWTNGEIEIVSGGEKEKMIFDERKYREMSCGAGWANVENELLYQLLWGRTKGLSYLPGGERNAPPYWKNCRLDMLAVCVEETDVEPDDIFYNIGYYVGGGKGQKIGFKIKEAGPPGDFFKGLVIMDGKTMLGLD